MERPPSAAEAHAQPGLGRAERPVISEPEAGTDGRHDEAVSPTGRRQPAAAPPGWRLRLVVFVVGAASLGTEIAAARLLAPYFGPATIVWATIATVLLALSVGYWLGGRLADRDPSLGGLCRLVLIAGLLLAAIPCAARPFLDTAVGALDSISVGAAIGSLAAVMVLVAGPVLLLGAVSPYAVRLALRRVESPARSPAVCTHCRPPARLPGTFAAARAQRDNARRVPRRFPRPGHANQYPADRRGLHIACPTRAGAEHSARDSAPARLNGRAPAGACAERRDGPQRRPRARRVAHQPLDHPLRVARPVGAMTEAPDGPNERFELAQARGECLFVAEPAGFGVIAGEAHRAQLVDQEPPGVDSGQLHPVRLRAPRGLGARFVCRVDSTVDGCRPAARPA